MAYDPNNGSESGDRVIAQIMGFDKWPREVSLAFDRALGAISLKYLKNRENRTFDFASVVADFRALETEYLARVGDNEENAQQVRRIITEFLLQMSRDLDEPFETCQMYWNDLVLLGFYNIERRCLQTGSYAVCCDEYGHTDMGIALLDPLIIELERLRAEPAITKQAAEYYDYELESLGKLRARLEAERA